MADPRPGRAVVPHADAQTFLRRAVAWLLEREDEHNLVLGLAGALWNTPPKPGPEGYFFATVEEEGEVVGAVFRTPPYKAGLTRMPLSAAGAVAEALAARYPVLPAVFGPTDAAQAVGRAWAELKGVTARTGMPQRIHRLDEVTPVDGVPGAMREARADELPLVHAWGEGFARDTDHSLATTVETRQAWVEARALFFWEDGGDPVSMALASGRTDRGVRIGYVYTPPERRGRGYASALVGTLTRKQLDEGASFCVLYTDLRNPTSNAIYARLGYRPLCDLVDVEFGEPE